MRRAVLANLKKWWPEAVAAALLILIGFAGQKDDGLFSVFVAIVLVIGWGMCARHKRLPLRDELNRVGRDVREVKDILLDAAGDEPGDVQGPSLKLVR